MDDGAGSQGDRGGADDGAGVTRPTALQDLDVAVAHWHVNAWGGAEYLVTRLAEAVGADRVYTIGMPDPDEPNPYGDVRFDDVTADLDLAPIRWIQRRVGRPAEYALWEDVDWRRYGPPDVLVTSGATTRAAIAPAETLHVNYCHSPARWLWDRYHDRKASVVGRLARPLLRHLRTRDLGVDARVDRYFANSPIVARRIERYYGRESTVLHPPLDLDRYRDGGDEGFYLHLGRLDVEKGVRAVVEAFAGTERRLVLAGGEGDDADAVLSRVDAADGVEYRGFVPENEKVDLLARCRAVVFNARAEDFGIVPVEANASGKACLARDEGFPGVFVDDGENGYCHDGTPAAIRQAVDRLERDGLSGDPRTHASSFDVAAFRDRLDETIREWYDETRIVQ